MSPIGGLKCRLWAFCGPKPVRVFYCDGGIGDELMLTAVSAAARASGKPLHVIAAYPEVWKGNADPASVQTKADQWHYARLRGWIKSDVVHLRCQTGAKLHLAEQMAAVAGVTLPLGWRPVYRGPTVKFREPRLIVIQNSCRGARYSATTKEWPYDRWQRLAANLAGDFRLVQIGSKLDPAIDAADDWRGKTNLREAAFLLSRAGAFVGLESGLQHLAAAVRTPSVIIFGGRTRPHETGYAFNSNLTREPACAGCGLNTGCPNNMVCMEIPVSEVEQAVRRTLDAPS